MPTNVEIEAKILIQDYEYERLIKSLNIKTYSQNNYYFDNSDYSFSKIYGLRIRYKNNKYELTLKEKLEEGKLETNQNINEDEFSICYKNNIFPNGEVKNKLEKLNIDINSLKIIGSLMTIRGDIQYKTSLISIDKNIYNNLIDYEVEAEDKTLSEAIKNLQEFLKKFNIIGKLNKTNKLERFTNSLR